MITSKRNIKESVFTYPCLMEKIENGKVVLFFAADTGIVVAKGTNSGDCLGYYSDQWNMPKFRRLSPSEHVTLSNEV